MLLMAVIASWPYHGAHLMVDQRPCGLVGDGRPAGRLFGRVAPGEVGSVGETDGFTPTAAPADRITVPVHSSVAGFLGMPDRRRAGALDHRNG